MQYKQEKCNYKYKWKKVAPNDIEDTKLKNGKIYHWYIMHKMWNLHKLEDCKLEKPNEETKKDDDEKGCDEASTSSN